MMRAAALALVCLLALCSCSRSRDGKAKEGASGENTTQETTGTARDTTGGAVTLHPGQTPGPSGGANAGGAGTTPSTQGSGQFSQELSQIEQSCPTLTVTEVLAGSGKVGDVVRVEGRCLGYAQNRAAGTPPLSRSDWQLEDGGSAVWVNGPLPEGCSPVEGSTTRTAIYAKIAEDTPPALGGQPAKARRYLVRVAR